MDGTDNNDDDALSLDNGAVGDGDVVRMAKLAADAADVTGNERSSINPEIVLDNGVVVPFI